MEYDWVIPSFYLDSLDLIGFYWGFTGFYWVLLGFTGFYWALLGCTGFDKIRHDWSFTVSSNDH